MKRNLFIFFISIFNIGFAQIKYEATNPSWATHTIANPKADSILKYNDQLYHIADSIAHRELHLVKAGARGIAAICVTLSSSLGSTLFALQGQYKTATIVSASGTVIASSLLFSSFYHIGKSGRKLARERIIIESEILPDGY